MSDNTPLPEPKSNSTLKWVLLASLLANALVVGFVVGNMGRGGFRPMMMMRGDGPNRQGPGDRTGDPATRDTLRESFQAERPALDKAVKDMAAARKQSAEIIRAETLDAAALDKSLADLRASSAEALESFHRSIAAAAAKLDAQHRASLARLLDRAPQGRGGMGGGMGGMGGPGRDGRGDRERLQGPPPGDMPPGDMPPGPPPGQ